MKRTALLTALISLLLSGCASSTDDEPLQECMYQNTPFSCPVSMRCGPGTCLDQNSKLCGPEFKTCGTYETCVNEVCVCGGQNGRVCSETCCADGCMATQTDPKNCGGCGIVCGETETCQYGICTSSCGNNLTSCRTADGERCKDLQNDPDNCGECGNQCALGNISLHFTGSQCSRGKCILHCETSYSDQNGNPADGCELKSVNTCGNGIVDANEVCDGIRLNDQTCATAVGVGSKGVLRCSPDCNSFITTGCSAPTLCGNHIVDEGEACDTMNLNGQSCDRIVGAGSTGTLECLSNCSGFKVTGCSKPSTCGNGIIDAGEVCDTDVKLTCANVVGPGSTGKLRCAENCASYDVSGCTSPATCGNGILESGEECDSTSFGAATCASAIGAGSIGDLRCTSQCRIDSSHCSAPTSCGDNTINGNDVCDGTALNHKTCADIVGVGSTGTLKCASNCAKYDISGCSASSSCNNGLIENGEICDGLKLNDQTCETIVGKGSTGTLTCNATCTGYVTTGCSPISNCGNGVIDAGESCDTDSFNGKSCESIVGTGSKGSLSCSSNCQISLANCSAPDLCGNGKLDKSAGEVCDGTDFNNQTCASIVGTGSTGQLACGAGCMHFDITGCSSQKKCGDGTISDGEKCDGTNLAGRTCADIVGTGSTGTLRCSRTCDTFDVSGCSPKVTCGNGSLDPGETCDSDKLNGWTCKEQVGPNSTGTPKCNSTCNGYEIGTCTTESCGNGKRDTGEDCDKTDFGPDSNKCSEYNSIYASGNLKCSSKCAIDTSSCQKACGNDKIDKNEVCDGQNFGSKTCASEVGRGSQGNLKCTNECKSIDTSGCSDAERCGDNILNGAEEECDGNDWIVNSCTEYHAAIYTGGNLVCNQKTCKLDVSQCTVKASCSDEGSVICQDNKLMMCNERVWDEVESCSRVLPVCSIPGEACLPSSWCNVQYIGYDENRPKDNWVGYSRIQIPDGVTPSDMVAYMTCTTDLSIPVREWSDVRWADGFKNESCSECGDKTEYWTPYGVSFSRGTHYCTFVYLVDDKYFACPPGVNSYSEPIPILSSSVLTKETTWKVIY